MTTALNAAFVVLGVYPEDAWACKRLHYWWQGLKGAGLEQYGRAIPGSVRLCVFRVHLGADRSAGNSG